MRKLTQNELEVLTEIANDRELLYDVARHEVENKLIKLRDSRISFIRGNGLCINEEDGSASDVIRMGTEEAMKIGLLALVDYLGGV